MLKKTLYSLLLLFVILNSCKKYEESEPDANAPFVWVVGQRTLMKSIDAGYTWKNYANERESKYLRISKENITLRNISFSTTAFGSIVGDDSLLYYTTNASDWQQLKIDKRPLTIYSSIKIDSGLTYFCGKNGYIASTDNIENFTTGVTYDLHGIDFINTTTGWTVGDSSTVLFTNDKGQTWTKQITASGNSYNAVYIHSVSTSIIEVWIIGKNGVIFKTTDSGLNWTPILSSATDDLTAICFTGSSTAYITGSNGLILKTSDNGSSFQKLNTGTNETINSISFMDESYGIAAGNKGILLRTSDSGNTWSQMPSDISNNLYSVCFVKRFKK